MYHYSSGRKKVIWEEMKTTGKITACLPNLSMCMKALKMKHQRAEDTGLSIRIISAEPDTEKTIMLSGMEYMST